jgi:hypothetical protein
MYLSLSEVLIVVDLFFFIVIVIFIFIDLNTTKDSFCLYEKEKFGLEYNDDKCLDYL